MLPRSVYFFCCVLTLSAQFVFAQKLYVKAYGETTRPTIIYVHGGPRGNATLFEATTAQALSERGFQVVVYDRRGEGRSIDTMATFTFREAIADLDSLIGHLGVKKVNIIGHSFGGIVSTMYAQAFPEKVDHLLLVGALFSQQKTYDHILASTTKTATARNDTTMLRQIAYVTSLDRQSAEYRGKTYDIASKYGYFQMPHPTPESEIVNKRYTDSDFSKNNIRNNQAPIRFYQNEKLVNIDTTPILIELKRKGIHLSALYGKQDLIFSVDQLNAMKHIVGASQFRLIDNCSHYPFVDQNETFLRELVSLMKLAR